ncbi:MAG TPA: Ig-like domain-containing protein [Gemmatimonadaceae bacterium]
MFKRIIIIAAAAASVACGSSNDSSGSTAGPSNPAVAKVTVTPPTLALVAGATAQLTATALDASGTALTGRTLTWSTSDATKATVTNGLVTGVAAGTATITVTSEGITGTAAVTVTAVPDRDFAITGVNFTQGVQDSTGSIPIVLGGNAMVANIMLSGAPASTTSMQVVLRLYNSGGALVRTDTAVTQSALGAAPDYAAPSVQVLVPASAIQSGLRWQVVRDPRGVVPDNDASNDVFPRTGTTALSTVAVPALNVRFVPIVIAANSNSTPPLTSGQLTAYLRATRSLHPLGAINAHVGEAFTTSANFGTAPRGGDASFWTKLISELDVARIADPTESTSNWYGVVAPPDSFNYAIYGGFSYIPTSGSDVGPDTRTSASVEINWFSEPSQARDDVAHELAHTFGRSHAPCGPAGAPLDASYPVPGGLLDYVGFDVYSWANGLATSAVAIPTTTGDVMGYCFPDWESVYTYKAVMAFRQPVVLASRVPPAAAVTSGRTRVLLIRGTIELGKSITVSPVFAMDARAALPSRDGEYRVDGLDAAGRTLFSYSLTPAVIDHAPNTRHFALAVPVSADVESQVDRVRVVGPEGEADAPRAVASQRFGASVNGSAGAARTASVPARVSVARVAGGQLVSASCVDAGARGVIAIDASTGTVVGVSDDASVRVMMASGRQLTMLCSDGVLTRRGTIPVP